MDEYEKSKSRTTRYSKILKLLKKTYGYSSFRPKQYEIINRIINGENVCAVLPTGYGKSLTFQVPALYLNKTAIIISPLISLMDDQKMILNDMDISVCCYNSNLDDKQRTREQITNGEFQFVYITPESLENVIDCLVELNNNFGISLIGIDEAHCISSYGFDFRVSYRKLNIFKQHMRDVPIVAVTATATNNVIMDICSNLGFLEDDQKYNVIKTSFDRPNLYLEISEKNRMMSDIMPLIKKHNNDPIIIYCLTQKETQEMADMINSNGYKCGVYHSGIDPLIKKKVHENFISGKLNIVSATIAFGMGINKKNVRSVIHYGCPKNMEGYYQEIGRAGRDGEDSYCYTFFSKKDFVIQSRFISQTSNTVHRKNLEILLQQMKDYVYSDKCRRKILLNYFEEQFDKENCNFCDNCCGKQKKKKENTTINVQKEAKMLIDIIEGMRDGSFGVGMYIDILRGSNNKKITGKMKKNPYYSKGGHQSKEWWKNLAEYLIKEKYLVMNRISFKIETVGVTRKGLDYSEKYDMAFVLEEELDDLKYAMIDL